MEIARTIYGNDDEDSRNLVVAIFTGNQLREINAESNQFDNLIDLMTAIRVLLGAMKADPSQLRIEALSVIKYFGRYTPSEVKLAVDLFIQNKLGLKPTDYMQYSVLFLSRILNSYEAYKQAINKELVEKAVSQKKMLPPPERNVSEIVDDYKDYFRFCFEQYQNKFEDVKFIQMPFVKIVYNYLKARNVLINLNINPAKGREYVSQRWRKFLAEHEDYVITAEKKEQDKVHMAFTYCYVLIQFFINFDSYESLEKFLSTIKENHFQIK